MDQIYDLLRFRSDIFCNYHWLPPYSACETKVIRRAYLPMHCVYDESSDYIVPNCAIYIYPILHDRLLHKRFIVGWTISVLTLDTC